MPMPLNVAADYGNVENIEGSKQGGGTIALVIMGHCSTADTLQGQTMLSAIKRRNLALLVNREHDGMSGRRHEEPDNVVELFG